MDIKYNTDTKIEDNARMYKLQKANFDKEINTAVRFDPRGGRGGGITFLIIIFTFFFVHVQKAESALAYELQAAKIKQQIRNEEIQIDVVERRKEIQVEEQEVLRKERELNATVRLPAEAESYRVQVRFESFEIFLNLKSRFNKSSSSHAVVVVVVVVSSPVVEGGSATSIENLFIFIYLNKLIIIIKFLFFFITLSRLVSFE